MLNVLIAEDEPWIRAALVEMVERIGHDIKVVGEATNGEEAWHMIQQVWPTVLITDIMMPLMDGLELSRRITEDKMPIAIIIISGYENFQYAQKAIQYGVSKYLLKPVKMDELKETLLETVGKLTAMEEMNHHLIRIQTYFDNVHELEPAAGLTRLYGLVDAVFKLKMMNYGAHLSLLRIIQSNISSLANSVSIEHDVMPGFKDTEERQIRMHLGQLMERWFLHPERHTREWKQVIRQACDYIHGHYQEDITLTEMADLSSLSISHFGALFKRYTGETLITYINQVRVEKAKELLRNTNEKIYQIAEEIGFSSQSYFIRVFKNISGMSPNEYRRSLGM